MNKISELKSLLPETMGSDRHALRMEILGLKRSAGSSKGESKKIGSLEKKIRGSIRKRTWRKRNRPKFTVDEALPIAAKQDEIVNAIRKHRVVVVSGETGSGKTTQLPKFCLAAGRGIDGKIGCTQPRRIAATTVSRRIAEELGEEIGKSVGYKIRFRDKTGENCFIKIMTDGILLAETQGDTFLNEYDTVIVDEAHERSLNIDFVLGILRQLMKKRKDLKLIITSATIDTEKFSRAFDGAPVIEVSGRMYPVEVRYEKADVDEDTHVEAAAKAVHKILVESPRGGDILVFMPTEQDIRDTREMLDGLLTDLKIGGSVKVLPLFARLSAAEQSKVFSRNAGRKIIVATNVAETSVTIPGIKYVVDTGLARISKYSPRTRTNSLPVLPVSRSSADQRKGRCGRVAKGVCYRLFTEEDYLARPMFTPPEILRSNLAEVILRMISLKIGDIADFPFIDRPAEKSIRDGFDLLLELGAIFAKSDSERKYALTNKGRLMAKMPVDPRLSRMLIEAKQNGCERELAVIASALSIQDPRERPVEKSGEADRAHAKFKNPLSDFVTLLNIWNAWHETFREGKGWNRVKKFCKTHFLSFRRMREWRDIHAQISEILRENRMGGDKADGYEIPMDDSVSDIRGSRYAGIHKSILSGFLSNIAMKKENKIFNAAKGREAMIFPGSGLFENPGPWIVAAEMVETSRLFARTAATIDAGWLEELGKDQCKSIVFHPHWERKRGEVVAFEQVSLYGLVIIPKRPVSYGPVDPDEASDIFIRSALVEGDVKKPLPFMKHNERLIGEVRDMENRVRRRDILIDEHEMYDFYKKRLEGIHNFRALERLIRKKGDDGFLRMKKKSLFQYTPGGEELSLFPKALPIGGEKFRCDYVFDPGREDDGVTVKIPADRAQSVSAEPLDWLVPGLLRDKIAALVKGLPKSYRKRLVPVAETVDIIAAGIGGQFGNAPLANTLGNFICDRFGVDIPASAWPMDTLPDHLRMRVEITGPKGEVVTSGRDKAILRQDAKKAKAPGEFEAARKKWEKTGLTQWDFEDLPESILLNGKGAGQWSVFPGLAAEENSVGLRLFHGQNEALSSHVKGVAKLYSIHFASNIRHLKKSLALKGESRNRAAYLGGAANFERRLRESVIADLFEKDIRTREKFHEYAETVKSEIFSTANRKLKSAAAVLEVFHETGSALLEMERRNRNRLISEFLSGLRKGLSNLVPETFLELYGDERIAHLQRYIRAVGIRAERGVVDFEKERARAREVGVHEGNLNGLLKELSPSVSDEKRTAIEEYFWLIEEYKVSVFAQELKTPFPVSGKRLEKKFREIVRMA